MHGSEERILTTHVGSLIRPPLFLELLRRIEADQPYDTAAYERTLKSSVKEIVQDQARTGLDIVSDGEFGKSRNWAYYVHDRLGGIERRAMTEAERNNPAASTLSGRDRQAFPEFYAELDEATGLKTRASFKLACTGPIVYRGHTELRRDIANLKEAAAEAGVTNAFLPVVAPSSALTGAQNLYYPDDRSFIFALADALREEYRTIVDAGLIVQIDDAALPFQYERMVPPATLSEYKAWAEIRIEALNHALEGIPIERSRYHICWGSWNGPHMFDIEMKDMVDLLLKVRVGAYLFEAANPRHEHEWRVWETTRLPDGKVIVPGVISHATNVVEHPELVAQRIVRFAKLVGRENVMAGTDCGFAQSPLARRVHPTIMWAKLQSLVAGARLASAELWGRSLTA